MHFFCHMQFNMNKMILSDMEGSVFKNCLKYKYIFSWYMVMALSCCKQLNTNKLFSDMAGSVFKVELFTLSNKLDGAESIWYLDPIFGNYKQVYYLDASTLIAGCKQWYVFHKKRLGSPSFYFKWVKPSNITVTARPRFTDMVKL